MTKADILRRRRLLALVAIVALVALTTVVLAGQSPQRERLGEARSWIDDDGRWATALESGETMAVITRVLLDQIDADECLSAETSIRCRGLLQTAAWAEVSSISALRCTRPGIFDLRADAREALDALLDGGDGLAEPPPVPVCR